MKQKQNSASDGNLASDISLSGIWQIMPQSWHPAISMMRLDRPIGWWLLLLPGWWVILQSAHTLADAVFYMMLFLIGAVAMRAAGCIINDLFDQDIDQKVARTAARPLASGSLSVTSALMLLGGLGVIGLLILLQLPYRAWLMGLASLPFIVTYPLFKRFTYWPQAMLGLTFSWGILLGHVTITDDWPSTSVIWLYAGTVFWVIGYDTIYAIQDMKDDVISGVKSSALAMQNHITKGVSLFYALTVLLLGIGFYLHFGRLYLWTIGLGLMGLHLIWQCVQIDEDNPKIALRLFQSNRDAGLLLSAGLFAELLAKQNF